MERPPPRTLLDELIRRSCRTIEETCAAFEQTARANGEKATLTPRQLKRWMAGQVGMARPVSWRRLLAVVDGWCRSSHEFDVLQSILNRELLMFDAISENLGAHAQSRRQALVTLAALPLSRVGPSAAGHMSEAAATESFLGQCAASLVACWHLLKGSDLHVVAQTLSSYLLELEAIANRQSRHREHAARLASQAHRIYGIVALHHNQLGMREHHCLQASRYAEGTSDSSCRAAALISLASTYFYGNDPVRAAAGYEQALAIESAVPPLQTSRIHAELSVVYAQLGRERDALTSVEFAEQIYPGEPEQDPSFLYAEFTRASLTLEQGLAFVALAEHFPGRGYQRLAADTFANVERIGRPVPDRIRLEITNHQARTAVLLNDLDAYEVCIGRAMHGAARLGSNQRWKEIRTVMRCAGERWPRERRLVAIGERARQAIDG